MLTTRIALSLPLPTATNNFKRFVGEGGKDVLIPIVGGERPRAHGWQRTLSCVYSFFYYSMILTHSAGNYPRLVFLIPHLTLIRIILAFPYPNTHTPLS